jgi:cysteine desulfurase
MIYLDHAAATPLDSDVLAAMQPFFAEQFYNPSAQYLPAQRVRQALETARSNVAQQLGARASEIIFTAGGTEANNLAVQGVLARYPDGHVVVSAIEHDAVLMPAAQYDHTIAKVTQQGIVDLADLQAAITNQTVLVSVMYANNEVGTIQPIRQVAQLVAQVREARRAAGSTRPIYLHTDACQAANYLDLHVSRLGVDMMTLNGGKIYGPKQSGVLYVASAVQLQPVIRGGGQERGLRSGTENVAACVGFAKALEAAQVRRHTECERLMQLQAYAYKQIEQQLPQAVINGSQKHRLPNNLHITLPGTDNERLLVQLDGQGILAAAGSACSASDEEPSHVLLAMGLSSVDAQSSLRITMGRATQQSDIDALIRAIRTRI